MADQIQKYLARLSRREFELIEAVLLDILNDELLLLGCKPLKGQKNNFRVRKGQVLIVFLKVGEQVKILHIGRRDDQTYRSYNTI